MSLLVKHFVVQPKAIETLNSLEMDEKEKLELAEIITLLYHQALLNKFLEALVGEDRKLFMEAFLSDSQEESFNFLREKITDIEKVVEEALLEIEEKIAADFEILRGKA